MTKVSAGITVSLDGYFVGPNDGPGNGLGDDGEQLHNWVFGGPWDKDKPGEATGVDKEFLDRGYLRGGAVVGGRYTFDLAYNQPDAWGDKNPFEAPFIIVTHRPEDEPEGAGFIFVNGIEEGIGRAKEVAGEKDVSIMGGGSIIRQALAAGLVDELSLSIAPITLGGGKRLFDGSEGSLNLEPIDSLQSPFATHITWRVLH